MYKYKALNIEINKIQMDLRRTTFLGISDHVYIKTKYSNKNIVFSTDNALLISFYFYDSSLHLFLYYILLNKPC